MTEEAREPPGVEVTGGGEPDMGIRNQMQLVGKCGKYSKTLSHLPSPSSHCSPNEQAVETAAVTGQLWWHTVQTQHSGSRGLPERRGQSGLYRTYQNSQETQNSVCEHSLCTLLVVVRK